MTGHRFTVMPLLLAMVVSIMSMPTDFYQVCAWNVGTVKAEPWKSKAFTASIVKPLSAILSRATAAFSSYGGFTGLPAQVAAMAIIGLALHAGHHDHGFAVMGLTAAQGLKACRQRAADINGELAKLNKERAAIGEKAIAESRKMTEQEKADRTALSAKIDALEADKAENAELLVDAEARNEADRNYAGQTTDADAVTAAAAATAAGVVRLGADNAVKAPGYFGRQLHAVKNAAIAVKSGGSVSADDSALLKAMQATGPTGANSDVPSDGGFLVAPDRSNTIIQRAYDTGQVLSRINRMPVSGNGMMLPAIDEISRADNSRFGGIVSGWLGQGLTLTGGKPKFRLMDLKLRKVGAFVYTTDELLQDAVALDAWINKYLPLELQFRTEDAVLNGDGSNKPQGAINSGAIIKVTRNTTGHITREDLAAMYLRMWAPLRGNAVFLIDQSCESDLDILSVAIGTAGVLDSSYKAAGSVPGQKYATYKNIPIIPVEYMAALGTTGDIMLVNLDEYTAIDKGGIEQAISLHVAFLTDESVYRFMYRIDGQLSWSAALTPKNGGNSLSAAIIITT